MLREEVPLAVDGLGKRKICDEYAELDAGIIAAHQKNRGLSGARNNVSDLRKASMLHL